MSGAFVPLQVYMLVAAALFVIGGVGFCVRRNVMVMLMCVELMLTAAALVFVAAARAHGDINGQVTALFIIALAATEVAVGLALVVSVFYNRRSVDVDAIADLKG